MKNSFFAIVIVLTNFFSVPTFSQNDKEPVALGLPGDNLNLYAVLDVFKKSKTLEDFEKTINEEDNKINNLDLNNDNKIDYIKVISNGQDDSHSIVLQVATSAKEKQDVAVIEVNKDKNNKIAVQIIGDKDLYGANYILEPTEKSVISGTPNPGYQWDKEGVMIINNTTTNNYLNSYSNASYVSTWPIMLVLYSPFYMPYFSPWHWGFYPPYWHPWTPIYFHSYYGYHSHYYGGYSYHRTTVIINPGHYNQYNSGRSSSIIVQNNNHNGKYNATYNGVNYNKPGSNSGRPSSATNRPSNGDISRPATRPPSSMTRPSGQSRPGGGSSRR